MWYPLPVLAEKYIHFPSGDQAASVHCAGAGPTGFPGELPSNGINRQGSHPLKSISTTGPASDPARDTSGGPCRSPAACRQSRCCARLSVEDTMAIWLPRPVISENRSRGLHWPQSSIQVSPAAFVRKQPRLPPSTGTTQVSHFSGILGGPSTRSAPRPARTWGSS